MRVVIRFGSRIRHPFFPDWVATPAVETEGPRRYPALSGTVSQLMEAADAGVEAARAVYVVRGVQHPFLLESEREAVWRTFQVPVYTVLLGVRGKTLAFECEAQEGLHMTVNCLAGAGWAAFFEEGECPTCTVVAAIDSHLCECGRPGHRLVNPRRPVESERRRSPAILPSAAGILA
ncbi:MAG TPA: hypothetical protein VME43_18515 [Bryobacteraceae bacterium]|nr:hypothetical protein [Bryobacteraceae bacterium]